MLSFFTPPVLVKKGNSGTSKHEPARKYKLHPGKKVARELKEVLSSSWSQVGQTELCEREIWTRTCWHVYLATGGPSERRCSPGDK